ncbi:MULTISPECIES: competence protein CoiA family protein [Pseudomonas]|uniref:competence protein CoiA family protein n=2 Tax=Gammaproteobacteria TaxID=1236 RepID=UPI0008FB6193|nr:MULTISPECIES: competence protein CoiA family protein [Pseudomonas]EIU4992196.1 hypothetical protein [Pseudomonas aeruginosa]EIY2609025.1 hypothetical protein [Pseudomonas aeruginosa]EIY2741334.1 hypothetical protein [Pseudomonas aeruginosa]EKM0199297.1 hypothetical protein [Pseudomonas aeruginosa]EKM0219631.1 hypothetical protein [Pseudomonas aeruginosa]
MTMTIAVDASGRVVSINEVVRGLACGCRCIECNEVVVARQGLQRMHHFSHASHKAPCEVTPESFLHRYAKQLVKESLGLQLPPQPGHRPDSQDQSSWWDFESVKEEPWMGDFRPDLVAELTDGPLLIEFACTSFVDEEKLARIEQLGIRTVEIDLSGLVVTPSAEGLLEIKRSILHDATLKQWLYPLPEIVVGGDTLLPVDSGVQQEPRVHLPERQRFTIQGFWVDLRVLEFGSVVVRSVAYSPAIAELLKRLSRRYAGRYVAKYKNWMFPAWTRSALQDELKALADGDSPGLSRAVDPSSRVLEASFTTESQPDVNGYLDARLILRHYRTGLAPGCLPCGEFKARHYGIGLDCDALEDFFRASGVELLGVEVIRIAGKADFIYVLRR